MIEARQETIADIEGVLRPAEKQPVMPDGEVLPPGPPMSRAEARRLVDRINAGFTSLRADLLALYEGRGWEALEYGNWRECVEAEFGGSQSRLYDQLKAAEIERDISEVRKNLPAEQLYPLADLPSPEERREAWQRANEESPKKVTAKVVKQAVEAAKAEKRYPSLSTSGWDSKQVLEARDCIEALPEEDREPAAALIGQPGIPADRALVALSNLSGMEDARRKETLRLYHSEDSRDQGVAVARLVRQRPSADPRRLALMGILPGLEHCARQFPGDPLQPDYQRLVADCKALMAKTEQQEQERYSGTDAN